MLIGMGLMGKKMIRILVKVGRIMG